MATTYPSGTQQWTNSQPATTQAQQAAQPASSPYAWQSWGQPTGSSTTSTGVATAAPTPQQQPTTPSPGSNFGWIGSGPTAGNWVPMDNPIWSQYQTYLSSQPQASAASGSTWAPGQTAFQPAANTQLPAYQPYSQSNPLTDILSKLATGQVDQGQAALGQAANWAIPNVAGQKEASKEGLLSLKDQQLQQMKMDAAARGVSGGGAEMASEQALQDRFNSNLTASNRSIDQQAQQVALANLLNLSGAQRATGAQQGQEALGLNTALTQADQQARAQQLAEMLGIGNLNIAGENQNLAQWVAQQQATQGQEGLDLQRELGLGSLDLQRMLGLGSQNLTQQQIDQQNAQFFAQLAQQGLQFGQGLDLQSLLGYANTLKNFAS